MPGGRPSSYSPEILTKARDYLDNPLPVDEVVHSIEGLGDFIGVHRDTIYAWEEDIEKEEFSDIVRAVRQRQAKSLINGGIKGTFNSSITKVMLTKHGYREGKDLTSDDKPLPASTFFISEIDDEDTDTESTQEDSK